MMHSKKLNIRKGASQSLDSATAARDLYEALYQPNISLALFYCSPDYDLDSLGAELNRYFEGVNLIGCTSAGEITPEGYLNGSITGVSVASEDFTTVSRRIDHLDQFEFSQGEALAQQVLHEMEALGKPANGANTFGFLLIDGLSMREEAVISEIYRGLGNIELFGGSAGDGVRFEQTYIYHQGAFHKDVAVFTLIHTNQPFTVFKTQHFVDSDAKMVVTEADPARRIVTEINGEPAGQEYARMVGLEVDKLTPLIFATHPVVVRVGGEHYVRSIQKVNDDESLSFFCAIDEGIVLTVAQGVGLVENLNSLFTDIREKIGEPQLVLGCDCILRSLELDREGLKEQVGDIMMENNVIGFSTYGEQYNAMHVNQTFTGVAIG
ncbi:MAG TPA: FIST domain containing protein [Gammaproteobacteria bacterium]|nr:FIST domain containing protein [Gammaproteobacteria bacterium]